MSTRFWSEAIIATIALSTKKTDFTVIAQSDIIICHTKNSIDKPVCDDTMPASSTMMKSTGIFISPRTVLVGGVSMFEDVGLLGV